MLLGSLLGLLACRGAPSAPPPEPQNSSARTAVADDPSPHAGTTAPEPAPALPALRAEWLEQLRTSAGSAVVTPPVGTTTPRPVVLGVHGAGDRPEWSCGGWRLASQGSSFVVCPRGGRLTAETFAWASTTQVDEHSAAAFAALQARFVEYVARDAPHIYAGFSQGATLAQVFLLRHAEHFPIAVFAEGGYRTLQDSSFARAYRTGGGRRVAIVCGTSGCFTQARRAKPLLERAGLQVLVIGDANAGHNLNERMQRALQAAWPEISAPLPGSAESSTVGD